MNVRRSVFQIVLAASVFGFLSAPQASAQTTEESRETEEFASDDQSISVDADGNLVFYDSLVDGELVKQMIFADGALGDPIVVRAPRTTLAARGPASSDCRVVGCPTGLRCVRIALFGRNNYACRPPRAPVSAGPTVTISGGQFSGGPANLSQYIQK